MLSSILATVVKIDYREQGQKQKILEGSYCNNPVKDCGRLVPDGNQEGDMKK